MGYAWKWLLQRSRVSIFGNILILVFLAAQLFDGVSTYIGISRGIAFEANPLASWLMSVMGVGSAIIALKIVAGISGIFIYWHGRYRILSMLTVIYLIVVGHWFTMQ